MRRRKNRDTKFHRAVEAAYDAIEKASALAKLTSRRRHRHRKKRRRAPYVRPLLVVYVEYQGFDVFVEKRIEQIAKVFGAEREGSGFSFLDGMRDISFAFVPRSEKERRSQGDTEAYYEFRTHLKRHRKCVDVDARRFISTILGEVPEVVVCKTIRHKQYWRAM